MVPMLSDGEFVHSRLGVIRVKIKLGEFLQLASRVLYHTSVVLIALTVSTCLCCCKSSIHLPVYATASTRMFVPLLFTAFKPSNMMNYMKTSCYKKHESY